ncbi:MAG TPA: preprotein translocase subunit SecG [Candidatus Eisenbacteria bacterium]|jgi:preprotein translocase subunit SecG|nr:preprotein translocase subunit SecG [Candidatus Eisenbacteria bacterium]
MKWAISLLVGVAIILVGFRWAGWLLTSFFVMNCFVLIIVVLLQSGKAADLAGAFGGAGSQTAFGPRGAATLLSRATTWCAVMFMICAMALVLRVDRADQGGSILQKFSKPAPATKPAPKPTPTAPATTPAPQSTTPQSSAPQSGTTPAPTQPAQSAPATPPATQPKKQ